jgi:hypothetical protein
MCTIIEVQTDEVLLRKDSELHLSVASPEGPSKLARAITLQTCIQGMLGSSLGWYIKNPEVLQSFYEFLQMNAQTLPKIHSGSFL